MMKRLKTHVRRCAEAPAVSVLLASFGRDLFITAVVKLLAGLCGVIILFSYPVCDQTLPWKLKFPSRCACAPPLLTMRAAPDIIVLCLRSPHLV